MNGSKAAIGKYVFDTYSPVIDHSSVTLLNSFSFGNGWEIRHWDISVAFTNALPEGPKFARFPDNMPDGIPSGFKGGDCAILLRN